ncbi:phosphotransferase enzyme family protein [Pedobacter psychrotolerans]|uniref:phosphotransferase enzyme family protein n=1 Tax=Pedobacter psychrotolerans TaxID=1843235 RepID=UPI003F9477FC
MQHRLFPAQYSTLSSAALQAHLIDAYQLPADTTCRLLIRNVSDTYLLENSESQYIFKIYRDAHRKLDEISGEVSLLNALKADGHSVSYPITDRHNRQIQQFNAIEGLRNGILFTFAPGKVIYDLNETQLHTLGTDIAKLHVSTSAITLSHPRPVFNFQTTLLDPLNSLQPHLKEMPEDFEYLKDIAQRVIQKFKSFDSASFSTGYCHYDLFPKNFHFDEKGKITLFDFDFAGHGYLVNDLMSFLNHYFFHQLNNAITKEQAAKDFNIFLDAYQQVRKLSPDEIDAIPYLGICFHLFFLKFFYDHFDDWSNPFLTPKFTRSRIELIRKWELMYCNF